MDVAASEFYGPDKTYDLNFKEEVNSVTTHKIFSLCLYEICLYMITVSFYDNLYFQVVLYMLY